MRPPRSAATIGAVIDHHARLRPQDLAWQDEHGCRTTFAAFGDRVDRLNRQVLSLGLGAGDRVAVLARNRPETFEVLGLGKSRIVTVPLNWRLTGAELLALLQHCRPRCLFVDREELARVQAMRAQLPADLTCIAWEDAPAGWLDYETWLAQAEAGSVADLAGADDPVCLLYTSGTTGQPKAVALSHRFVVGNAYLSAVCVSDLREEDRVLAALPFFHVGGLFYHGFASFWAGCATIVLPRFDAARVLSTLVDEHISHVHLVPTMVAALLDHPAIHEVDLSHLRLLFYAASPMPLSLLQRAMRRLPDCGFVQSYGSTEVGMVSVLSADDHRQAGTSPEAPGLNSCGRALPEVRVRAVGLDGQPVAVGEIGELEILSPYRMQGYWHNDEANRLVWHDSWLRTGDLAYFDAQQRIVLVDRRNDMIVSGGENVYPSEVEAQLQSWPEIHEAAVLGVPDPHWGERVVAAVVCRDGHSLDAESLRGRLRQVLAPYKCPREVRFFDTLPKNATGKVLRKVLRAEWPQANQHTTGG